MLLLLTTADYKASTFLVKSPIYNFLYNVVIGTLIKNSCFYGKVSTSYLVLLIMNIFNIYYNNSVF